MDMDLDYCWYLREKLIVFASDTISERENTSSKKINKKTIDIFLAP